MNRLIIILSTLILSGTNLQAQERIIKGIVISEELELLPHVAILSSDSIQIGITNINGEFEISVENKTNQLMFQFLGMESISIEFPKNCEKLEVIMMYEYTYSFMSLRKADRLRKKRFKKLSKIREKAYKNGIFESKSLNYEQEFIYYKSQ